MLAALIFLLAVQIVLLFLLVRQRARSATCDEIRVALESRERTQLDALERVRASLEEGLRRSAQLQADTQRDWATQLATQVHATREETKTAIADRFAEAHQIITGSLAEARKSQDERLERVDLTLKNIGELMAKAALEERDALIQTL